MHFNISKLAYSDLTVGHFSIPSDSPDVCSDKG